MRIAPGPAQRGTIDEIDMTAHHLGEGGFGAFFGIAAKQRGIIVHAVYPLNNAGNETEQRIAPGLPSRAC